jgi:hypothetical protein
MNSKVLGQGDLPHELIFGELEYARTDFNFFIHVIRAWKVPILNKSLITPHAPTR